jgi:hypothetical protein
MITISNVIVTLCRYRADLKANLFQRSQIRSCFFFLFILPYLFLPMTAKGATIFKSGFETSVTMSDFISSTNWYKKTYGSDKGYDWNSDLPGGSANFWNLILNSATYPNPSECLELDITTDEAHTGSRSLHMRHVKQCKYNSVIARVSYLPTMGLWPYDETHIKFWLKLPNNFDDNLKADGTSGTANFNEIRMSSADLRIVFDIVTVGGGPLKFRAWAEDISSGWNPHWIETSNETVPIGEWFQVEIYFHVKTYAEGGGAYWIKINGKKIIEVIPTATKRICGSSVSSKTCDNPSDWNLIKLYTYENDIEAFLDDFEIYNTLTINETDPSLSPPLDLKIKVDQ